VRTYCHQIHPTQDKDDDARADDNTPECHAERFLASSVLVEVAEHVDTDNDHRARKTDESMGMAEKRPVAGEVAAEDRELRSQEEHAGDCGEDVGDGVEEEELGGSGGLDQHDDAGGNYGQQTDDVHDPDAVEDDVAWTGQ